MTIEDRYEMTGLCCSCVIVCCFARSSFNSFLLIQRFKKGHFSECYLAIYALYIAPVDNQREKVLVSLFNSTSFIILPTIESSS